MMLHTQTWQLVKIIKWNKLENRAEETDTIYVVYVSLVGCIMKQLKDTWTISLFYCVCACVCGRGTIVSVM